MALAPRTPFVTLTVAATLALAACGGDSSSKKTTSSPPPAASTPTTTPAPDTGSSPSGGSDISEAGKTVPLGTRVVAPYSVYHGVSADSTHTKLAVTVLRVRKGTLADFKDFNLDKEQKNTVPYYVDVKFKNLGTEKLKRFLIDVSIEDSDGQEYKPISLLTFGGTFKVCPQPSDAKLRPGESFTRCAPILLPNDKTYERVRFQGDGAQDPYFWK